MSRSEDWYRHSNHKEFFVPIFDPLFEQRIRVRIIKEQHGKFGKKRVKTFSVGYELQLNGKWFIIIRHCNYHEESKQEFHTHNPKRLSCIGSLRKIRRKNRKKNPGSQMRWAIKNIRLNYLKYRKNYLRKVGRK